MNTKRAIAILRVSTDAQDTDRQKTDIERVERAHSLSIERTVPLDGVSGRKVRENADMLRVLADLKRPDIDGVVVSALDRLFRLDKFADFGILDHFKDTGKTIWSAKEGALDLRTDAGLILSLMSGAQSGLEWRELRRRTTQGKELLRTRGGNPNGSLALPRGIGSEPIKDAKGRSIGARWFYVEPDASRVRQAYELLFERLSWEDIAERIGGGFTDNGVRNSLKNPIWKGVRVYSDGRETPLEVPIDIEPLIPPARWAEAQKIILEKRTRWAKSRRAPHVLLSGMLRCRCGKPCYVRISGKSRGFYYCSTGFPGHGPKCGARSVQQEPADQTVERVVSTQLLDAAYLRTVLGKLRSSQPTRGREAGKLAHQREKLEAERQRLLRLTLKGACSEDDFARESKRIEQEMRDLDLLTPAPLSAAFDAAKLVVHITRTFARFAKQPLEEKRTLLRSAVRDIVLEDGAVTAITLNGAFLDCVNSEPRSRWLFRPRCRGRGRVPRWR
jgi:site-specific DNA recombinase